MLESMYQARSNEVKAAALKIDQRMEFARILQVERLENALRSARAHLPWISQTPVKA